MKTFALAKPLLALVAVLALPALAHAHPGHDGHDLTWSFGGGLAHPFGGFDHLLAMIAVGLWAAQRGGRSRWLVPATFVGMMALGAAVARTGLALSGIEQGIAASLLVLGLLIACTVKLPAAAGMAVAGLFALFHGAAHGAEMPATGNGLLYGAGFIAATALLHAAGLGFGFILQNQAALARLAGGTVAAAGVAALLA